jgi:exosortase/archaeosortase family protein
VHIETGVIDIDEACSGIRSLQAMVMISLFLGELFRLKPGRRVLLMAFGIAATLLANVIRTVALARIGFSRGMGAIDNYHDAAGFAVLLLALAGTLLTAFKLRTERAPAPRATATGLGLPLPVALSGALLIWLCLGEISVEAWYRAHQPEWQGWSWTVSWPRRSEGFHFIDIPRRSLRLLMCDESQAAAWKEPDGAGWSLYWLRWNPGNPQAEAAKVHRPDVCLNAAGAIMENDTGTLAGPAGIPFHSYTFLLGDKTLHVFFCLYEEGAGGGAPAANPHFEGTGMLERALKGRRHIGEQSLELALSGYPSVQSAQAAFEARLGQLMEIRRGAIAGAKE